MIIKTNLSYNAHDFSNQKLWAYPNNYSTNQRLLDPVHYYDPTLKVKCGGKCNAKLDQYLRYPL